MKDFLKRFKIALLIGLAGFVFTACERQGPLEEAGEDIDEAFEEVTD